MRLNDYLGIISVSVVNKLF